MNSAPNRPANSYPQLNDFGDARAYLDSLRNALMGSWSGVEHVIKSLSDSLQEKTNYIEALRADLTVLQNDKIHSMQQMDQKVLHLQRQLQEQEAIIHDRNSKILQTELNLQKVLSESKQRLNAGFEASNELRAKISSYEQNLRFLSAQNEQLKLKLTRAEQQQRQPVTNLEFNLTEEQENKLREHIDEEITKRAAEVTAKAKDKITQAFKGFQERIKDLEEQLEASRAINDKSDTSDKLVRRQSVPHLNPHAVIQADLPPPSQGRSDNIADELNSISQQNNLERGVSDVPSRSIDKETSL